VQDRGGRPDELRAAMAAGTVRAFALFTGHLSEGNLRLYRRLGYAEVGRRPLTDRVVEVHLIKSVSGDQFVDKARNQRGR
jgi:hypothetical protein